MARFLLVGALAAALVLAAATPGAQAKAKPVLVSIGGAGEKANSDSFDPVTSRAGRYVAFESDASNLDPADSDGTRDVFVRDTETGSTMLVSRADGFVGVNSDGHSDDPSISPDGRFVAFTSEATNLHPGLVPGSAQVYVRDLASGSTTLVSRSPGADGTPGPGFSSEPVISADGRFVAFESTGILGVANGPQAGVFVRDLVLQTTTLVSRSTGADGQPANDLSFGPSISADGSRVAFTSYASNLAADHPERLGTVYVRDLATERTSLEARASGRRGTAGNSEAGGAALAADGETLAFLSDSTNLVDRAGGRSSDVYSRNLESAKTRILSRSLPVTRHQKRTDAGALVSSGSGRRLAFAYLYSKDGGGKPRQYVFAADLRSGETDRIPGLSQRWRASIDEFELSLSPEGQSLAFQSTKAFQRTDGDGLADIYLLRVGG